MRLTLNCCPKILKTRGEISSCSRAKARPRVAPLPVSKGEFVFEYIKALLLIPGTTAVVHDRRFPTSGCFFKPLVHAIFQEFVFRPFQVECERRGGVAKAADVPVPSPALG